MPLAVVIAAGLAGGTSWWALRPEAPRIVRTSIVLTGNARPTNEFAITPDGTRVMYVSNNQTQILVRALDNLESRPLVSGNNVRGLFASPDGQSVGYIDSGNALMKVALTGGAGDLNCSSGCGGARRHLAG
jgi:hypothetical protein